MASDPYKFLPDFSQAWAALKETVLGFPSLNLMQRLLSYALLGMWFIVFMLVILPRFDCWMGQYPEACTWVNSQYQVDKQ
jgi:hypothetical protein